MSATRSPFPATIASYMEGATGWIKKIATFKPLDHFVKGASQIFRAVTFLKDAPQTLAVVKDILEVNISHMAAPLVAYSLVRNYLEQQSTENQLIGIMAFDSMLTAVIKVPVWIMHTAIDNPAYSLMLPRTIANDVAHLLPHKMAKLLSEQLSPIFVEIFVRGEKNQQIFADHIYSNLFPVFSGFVKNPTKISELEKMLEQPFATAVKNVFDQKNLIPSDFTKKDRQEVIQLVVKNIVSSLSEMLGQKNNSTSGGSQIIPPGMKQHLAKKFAISLIERIQSGISKALLEVKPFLPQDSIESCQCNVKKKTVGSFFKPFYMMGYVASSYFPTLLNNLIMLQPVACSVMQAYTSYLSLLLKVNSVANKITGCTRHSSQTFSANHFYYLAMAIMCQAIEECVEKAYFNFSHQYMNQVDRFLLNDALVNISLTFGTIASTAFTEKLPAKNKKIFDLFLLPRVATRKTIQVVTWLNKVFKEMFFEQVNIPSVEDAYNMIKNILSSSYIQVTAEWMLQRKTLFPNKLVYLMKNSKLKQTKEYQIELFPIILERSSVKKMIGLYEADITKALSMIKVLQVFTECMRISIRSPVNAFITTCLLWPIYFLQDKSFDKMLKQLENVVEEHNKKFQVAVVEESDLNHQPLVDNAVIVSGVELEQKEEEDYLLIEEEPQSPKEVKDAQSFSLYEMPKLISYASNTIWQRLTLQNKASKKDWDHSAESENNTTAFELKTL